MEMKTRFSQTQTKFPVMMISLSQNLFSGFIMTLLALFSYTGLNAQNLPPADRCTSKDLELVNASIVEPGVDCECTSGLRTLRLTINNKTGSTRTSFAAWGTLVVNGNPASATPIFACGGPLPPKSITEVVTETQINYTCGTTLKITDLFLAWTSASPNETCDVLENNPAGISPKCGTLASITVDVGAVPGAPTKVGDVTECEQSPTQTLSASNQVTVPPGITVTWYNMASGGSVVSSPTLNAPGTVTYYAEAANGACKSPRTPVTLTIHPAPAAPVKVGNVTECAATPTQILNASNQVTVPAGVSVTWYTAASGGSVVNPPNWNSIGSVTYYAEAKNNITNCTSLSRTPVTLTINAAPASPSICVTEPSLCGPATGSLTILSPLGSYEYSINGGSSYQTGVTFSGLAAGSNPQIVVKNTSTTCVSAPSGCNNYSDCSSPKVEIEPEELPTITPVSIEQPELPIVEPEMPVRQPDLPAIASKVSAGSEISVKAFPNPFNNEVKFNINIPEAANGRLELVNTLGQKVKTVFDGPLNEGLNAFEVNISSENGTSTLFYILYVGDRQFTGKLLRTNGSGND